MDVLALKLRDKGGKGLRTCGTNRLCSCDEEVEIRWIKVSTGIQLLYQDETRIYEKKKVVTIQND